MTNTSIHLPLDLFDLFDLGILHEFLDLWMVGEGLQVEALNGIHDFRVTQ